MEKYIFLYTSYSPGAPWGRWVQITLLTNHAVASSGSQTYYASVSWTVCYTADRGVQLRVFLIQYLWRGSLQSVTDPRTAV